MTTTALKISLKAWHSLTVTDHGIWRSYSAQLPSGQRLQGAADARPRPALRPGAHAPADKAADSVPGDRLPLNRRLRLFQQQTLQSRQGAALIGVIVAIIVVASIGTAIFSMTATSNRIQLNSIDSLNGLSLAEAGKNFALQYINQEMAAALSPDTGTIPLLNNKTFTLPGNAGQFRISLSHTNCPGSACLYQLISIGISNNTAARELTYQIRPY